MKSFTDIPQSKKLAEILPIKSADMYYWCGEDLRIGGYKAMDTEFDIPCWSLAALLSVIPEVSLNTFKDGKWGAMVQRGDKMIYEDKDNPVDACYEMILKLKEKDLL